MSQLPPTEEPKSKNQLKNEAKRKEKAEKFAAKLQKQQEDQARLGEKKEKAAASYATTSEASVAEHVEVAPGEKKPLHLTPMAAAYCPTAVEASWYAWWESQGFFKAEWGNQEAEDRETFVLAIPPPNVTGSLHLGHSMMASIQDSIVRFKRMQGKRTLYVPGCDHAGIATQVVVEKKLKKESNLSRHDLGREKFMEEVWKWKEKSGDRIYLQLKRMGISADWDRACFTMDEKFAFAVNEAFIKLHADGLIFRDNRLVNWSGKIQTALSELEVDSMEIAGPTKMRAFNHDPKKEYTFGLLYSFAYALQDASGEIVVATTRPETIFGDVAIAVNPTDARYAHLKGKFVVHPFNGQLLPIIFDNYADKDFGTGAVKITPAHDPNDFRIGKTHKLPFINVLDDDNALNAACGSYEGMKRFDARIAVVEAMKEKGLFRGEAAHSCVLPICSRSGDIVEPRLKPQWWLNCKEMARKACEAVRTGELEILPQEGEREWFKWLENIQDWCLSRQLWWGHRIPVWHVNFEDSSSAKPNPDSEEFWICARSKEEAAEIAASRFPNKGKLILTQDEDVLDTWFSSGLWPFGIFGWPNANEDLEKYFPNSMLETGKDILFFWVARMVMMSIQLTGKIPFKQILLHTIVRDAHGRKMSKSLGNVVDPIDVIEGISLAALQEQLEKGNLDPKEVKIAKEGQKKDFPKGIPQCGTDALRFCLLASNNPTRDVNLDIQRVEGYRKFCNKIWNATRFCLSKFDNWQPINSSAYALCGTERLMDLWILQKLNIAIEKVTFNLENYNFMAATTAIYSFWLYDLCDVYIEAIKPTFEGHYGEQAKAVSREVLYECFDAALKLLHPFMPFVTEELYQRLPRRKENAAPSIMVAMFPVVQPGWKSEVSNFESIIQIVERIRSVAPATCNKNTSLATLKVAEVNQQQVFHQEKKTILSLVKLLGDLKVVGEEAPEEGFQMLVDCRAKIRFE